MLGADDSLDVFGVHGVGGIVGALLTGVFNSPGPRRPRLGGRLGHGHGRRPNGIGAQVWIQLKAVLLTIVWSGVVSFVAFKIVDLTIGLRVSEEEEREGLDITSHGETAYQQLSFARLRFGASFGAAARRPFLLARARRWRLRRRRASPDA